MTLKMNAKTTSFCPCQSGKHYDECCHLLHSSQKIAETAEMLMRSRYAAFSLHLIDYIVKTTVPSQQHLLDQHALLAWATNTQWIKLKICNTMLLDKIHSAVEFQAFFIANEKEQVHHEKSLFVKIKGQWFFANPSVSLPAMKQPCICGSGKKFKHCCGEMLCTFYAEI